MYDLGIRIPGLHPKDNCWTYPRPNMNAVPSKHWGLCRLCSTPGQLEHSHVISRLMFRPMSHLMGGTPIRCDPMGGTTRPGHLKEYMLCGKCEDQFCDYEHVAAPFFRDINDIQQRSPLKRVHKSSLDYHNIKLFFLSLLWRCAVSQDPITQNVRLGSRLQSLSNLLQSNTPGAENEFPIVLRVLDESREAKNAVLTVPIPMRRTMRRGYAMVGNGVEISWVTDSRGVSSESEPYILHRNGNWLIEMVPGSKCVPWVEAVTSAHDQDRRTAK